jgi:hypothetical protein
MQKLKTIDLFAGIGGYGYGAGGYGYYDDAPEPSLWGKVKQFFIKEKQDEEA